MLDKRSTRLLDVLLTLVGGDGSYKVIEKTEIIAGMGTRWKIDAAGLDHMLIFLSTQEMIDVKHSDETDVAVAILPKGRVHEETAIVESAGRGISKKIAWLIILGTFVAATVGATIGVMAAYFLR